MLLNIFATITSISSILTISLLAIVYTVFLRGKSKKRLDSIMFYWCRFMMKATGTKVQVNGIENIPKESGFIMMVNHTSLMDIPLSYYALLSSKTSLRMLTKKELFKVPIWGQAMRLSGFIPIDRKNREKAIESLNLCKKALQDGISIWIAPEGTRSKTGTLQQFKKGGFITAIETGAKILPVAIHNAHNIIKTHSFLVQRGANVRIEVGNPITTNHYTVEQKDELVELVYQWFHYQLQSQEAMIQQ